MRAERQRFTGDARKRCHFRGALAEGFEHAVTLVEDKVFQLLELEVLAAKQPKDAAGRADNDVRRVALESRLVGCDGHACSAVLDRGARRPRVVEQRPSRALAPP